jgi:hypothetical protein
MALPPVNEIAIPAREKMAILRTERSEVWLEFGQRTSMLAVARDWHPECRFTMLLQSRSLKPKRVCEIAVAQNVLAICNCQMP